MIQVQVVDLVVEAVLLLFVLACVRILFHYGQKLARRNLENRSLILLLYFVIFYGYCDIMESIINSEVDVHVTDLQQESKEPPPLNPPGNQTIPSRFREEESMKGLWSNSRNPSQPRRI